MAWASFTHKSHTPTAIANLGNEPLRRYKCQLQNAKCWVGGYRCEPCCFAFAVTTDVATVSPIGLLPFAVYLRRRKQSEPRM